MNLLSGKALIGGLLPGRAVRSGRPPGHSSRGGDSEMVVVPGAKAAWRVGCQACAPHGPVLQSQRGLRVGDRTLSCSDAWAAPVTVSFASPVVLSAPASRTVSVLGYKGHHLLATADDGIVYSCPSPESQRGGGGERRHGHGGCRGLRLPTRSGSSGEGASLQ